MDVTHKFKEIAIWVCKLGGVGMGVFCLVLEAQSKRLLFIASFILGYAYIYNRFISDFNIINLY